jgi:hypothetical protein
LAAVVPVVVRSPEAGLEPLLYLKAAAVRGGATRVAAALQEAIDLAHRGQSAQGQPMAAAPMRALAGALARAQRLLDPPIQATTGPVEWGGGVLP